jgi:lipoate-protein ligase A
MLHVLNSCTDPCYNLALEEYFLKYPPISDDFVILWKNDPTVVIGRNQNAAVEINLPFIAEHNIQVVRRLSGGGTVYHDPGNLNFTFITSLENIGHNNFSHFTQPIIMALAELGIKAEFTGRNDLTIEGEKFSGNAQYIYHNRLLHHGTLLFDTDMQTLGQALSGSDAKHTKPAVPSVRSKVTTIRRHLPSTITLAEFEETLLNAIFANAALPYKRYPFTTVDQLAIEALADKRYRDTIWTYGMTQPYNFSHTQTFSGGTVQVLLNAQNEILQQCKICGDFFATGDMDELAGALRGTHFSQKSIAPLIESWLADHPIHNISSSELLSCFFPHA